MTRAIDHVREEIERDFWVGGFRDYLALEAGSSENTVSNYRENVTTHRGR